MRKIVIILSFIGTISLNAQKHIDAPFIQDFANKFELNEELSGSKLLQVRSDRNKHINIVSAEKLLHTGDKVITENSYYRPFENMTVISMETYQNQFVYLTKDAVLSNAWTGKYYVDHGLKNPSKFVLGKDFSTLVAGENEVAFFVDSKKVWNKKIKGLNPIELIADETGDRFFILAEGGVYQLLTVNNKFSKIYEGSNLTAIALHKGKIVIGTNEGIVSLDASSFEASDVNRKLPFSDITALENIDGSLWFGSKNGAFKLRKDGKYDYGISSSFTEDGLGVN
jgi:ligand-binding sensor domain-containing protein